MNNPANADPLKDLFKVISERDLLLFKELIVQGVDFNSNKRIYIREIMRRGNLDFIKYIVNHLNTHEVFSDTHFLDTAARGGHVEILSYLKENGVDVTYDDDHPLFLACKKGHTKTVQWLLNNGAKVKTDELFIGVASQNNHIKTLRLLIEQYNEGNPLSGSDIKKIIPQIIPEHQHLIKKIILKKDSTSYQDSIKDGISL